MRACQSCQVFAPIGTSKEIDVKSQNFSVSFKVKNLPSNSPTPETLKIVSHLISPDFEVIESETPLINDVDFVVMFQAKKSHTKTSSEFLAKLFLCLAPKDGEMSFRNDFLLVECEHDSIILHLPDGTCKEYKSKSKSQFDTSKAKLFLEEILKLLGFPMELVIVTRSAEEAKVCLDTLFLRLEKKRLQSMKIWFTVSKTFRHHQVMKTLEKLNEEGTDQVKEILLSDYMEKSVILSESDIRFLQVDFRFLGNAEKVSNCTRVLLQRLKISKKFDWSFDEKELNNDSAAREERYGIQKFLRHIEAKTDEDYSSLILVEDPRMLEILKQKLCKHASFPLRFAAVKDKENVKYPMQVEIGQISSKGVTSIRTFDQDLWKFKSWSPETSEKFALKKSSRSSRESRTKSTREEQPKNPHKRKRESTKSPPRKIPNGTVEPKKDKNDNSTTQKEKEVPKRSSFEIKLAESAIPSEEVPTGPWKLHLPQGLTLKITQSPADIERFGKIAQTIVKSNENSEAFVTLHSVTKTKFHILGEIIGTAELTQEEMKTCTQAFSFFCPVTETTIESKRSKWVKMQAKSNVQNCEEQYHAVNLYSVNDKVVPRLNTLSRYVMQNVMSIYVINVSSDVQVLSPSQCIIKAVCHHGHYEESQCFSKK